MQNKWLEYEIRKRDIERTAKSAEEYERRIRELARRMKI